MEIARRRRTEGLRQEVTWAIAETGAIFLIFIVAFTGRDTLGDGAKTVLTILSVMAGVAGTTGALIVARRALAVQPGRLARFGLAGWMAFAGLYTIVHVLS
ncbi:MAG: hypothetical protein ACRD1H_20625 [Vicinamibacterales bacterium]